MLGQKLERRAKSVTLPGSVVQGAGDVVAPFLCKALHRRAFRDVLANQSVGVLVRASLPGSVRRGKVDRHAGGVFNRLVTVKLRPVVDRDGDEEAGMGLNQLNHAFVHVGHLAAEKPADDRRASDAFNERDHAMIAARTDDDVHLPVTDLLARVHRWWPFGDVPLARKPTALFGGAVALPVSERLPKMLPEFAAPAPVLVHVRVDGLVTDLEDLEKLESPADLFGAELIANETLNELPFDLAEVAVPTRTASAAIGMLLSHARPVGVVVRRMVACKLSTDRAAMTTDRARHLRVREALLP